MNAYLKADEFLKNEIDQIHLNLISKAKLTDKQLYKEFPKSQHPFVTYFLFMT